MGRPFLIEMVMWVRLLEELIVGQFVAQLFKVGWGTST